MSITIKKRILPSIAREMMCPFLSDSVTTVNCDAGMCMAWESIEEVNKLSGDIKLTNSKVVSIDSKEKEVYGFCKRLELL